MTVHIKEVDHVSILSLQDNYVDCLAMDSTDVVKRPLLLRSGDMSGGTLSFSPLAEHGFSTFVTVSEEDREHCMLFDFGCSPEGAAFNADLLNIDLTRVEALALSHGHFDHWGGMKYLVAATRKTDLELVVHPEAFLHNRHVKLPSGSCFSMPDLLREDVEAMGAKISETTTPLPMLGGTALFLGEIPRTCEFEKGMPNAFRGDQENAVPDAIKDDSAMVFHVRDKGLVVLTGCAHAGIINTVRYAREVTGVEKVHAVMGGFHLPGPMFAHAVEPTIKELQALAPDYVIPGHCTGRPATLAIEKAMPDQFLVNMSGTTMVF